MLLNCVNLYSVVQNLLPYSIFEVVEPQYSIFEVYSVIFPYSNGTVKLLPSLIIFIVSKNTTNVVIILKIKKFLKKRY